MLHGRKEVTFVSFIIFTLCPDTLSLNGSIMIINQSIIVFPAPELVYTDIYMVGVPYF